MASVTIHPVKLPGPWTEGFVLECQHTVSSTFLGTDSSGHDRFDTKRSELGELVYQLKNRGNRAAAVAIAGAALQFLEGWRPAFDLIVPVPPSKTRSTYQPVSEIANAIGKGVSKPVVESAVRKVKATPELKNVFDYEQRVRLLENAFVVEQDSVSGKGVMLIDDLYRSGATAAVVARSVIAGGAAAVYMLAITKTRTRT
jgi:competence protein ComFC